MRGIFTCFLLVVISPLRTLAQDYPPATAPPAPPAEPEPEPSAWATRPLAIEGHLGLGTPLGYAGAALDYSPLPALSLNAGIGQGATRASSVGRPSAGIQAAGGLRLRPLAGTNNAFAIGGSLSLSKNYTWVEGPFIDEPAERAWTTAYWGNLDLGYEYRAHGGFAFRVYTGASWMLNPTAGTCIETQNDLQHCQEQHTKDPSGALIYIGVSIGYAFAL